MLARDGISGVSMRAVAREADVAMVEPDDTTGPAGAAKAAEILVTQNDMWLATILIDDVELRARALATCERIAFS